MSLDFSSLSIDAVGGARDAQSEAKINQQAQNNVKRARAAADLRGTSSSSAQAPAPTPTPTPPAKKAVDPKVLARKAAKISKFLSNPMFAEELQGIISPSSRSTEADLDFVLEQINERLNSGMGPAVVKTLWLKAMIYAEQPLTRLPAQAAIPPGSHNYAAMRMNELNREFEQLAIEYDHLFAAGPIPRLLMKTANILTDYKMAVEKGEMPMLIDQAPPEEGEAPPPPPEETETETEMSSTPKLPPPMKIYPDPVHEFIPEPMPQAPVFSSDIAATSTGKSVTRGRGKKRGGI